ncbi:MAG TPA: type II toxin-antitoxin system VapC family toxin [Candidatus Acidoferrum sp.]|nr:type II toxin-antitoxin system VapC family toxin [Candidatus Acidoferrum sp.]
MKLLLDTHIWIWLVESPGRVGRNAARELRDTANELWLSPVSTWEVLLLHRKKRLFLPTNPEDWLPQALAGIQRHAPITHEIVMASEKLPLHNDPADRFIAATALVHDLTLVTADQRLLGLGPIRTMANR